ncbi:MAG: helix-turn-helix transcriptional regulator [Candidatus Protochlamydia sp.]|nr:helix-turn-helix transcriptional regulator [Candidatus Protochlamydia sp.]
MKHNLKEYIDENGMTYRQFAEQLGIRQDSLKGIVYGKKNPSVSLAIQIQMLTKGRVILEVLSQDAKEEGKKKISKRARSCY